jgi:glycerate kinase
VRVSGPLKATVDADWVFDRGSATAFLECAQACGLTLIGGPPTPETAMAAHSKGVGQLIAEALRVGATRIVVGLGGSACTDGGQGMIAQLGGLNAARRRLDNVELIAASDTEYPLLGPWGAARVFGPQKGASERDVALLSDRLADTAAGFARDPRGVPMTGAAGGLSGGLWAELEAELVPGASFVLDAVSFDSRLRAARAVVTGEGKLDQQSLAGKLVSEIATRARQTGVPCHAIVGTRELDSFGQRVLDLQAVLEASTEAEIEAAGRRLSELI